MKVTDQDRPDRTLRRARVQRLGQLQGPVGAPVCGVRLGLVGGECQVVRSEHLGAAQRCGCRGELSAAGLQRGQSHQRLSRSRLGIGPFVESLLRVVHATGHDLSRGQEFEEARMVRIADARAFCASSSAAACSLPASRCRTSAVVNEAESGRAATPLRKVSNTRVRSAANRACKSASASTISSLGRVAINDSYRCTASAALPSATSSSARPLSASM